MLPKSDTFPFVVPLKGGERALAVQFRPATIDELLATQNLLAEGLGRAISRLLSACTVTVDDPGPWRAPGTEAVALDWARVPSGIRMQALFRLRFGSRREGHRIQADLVCPHCAAAEAPFSVIVDARPIEEGGELLWYSPLEPLAVLEAITTGAPLPATVGGAAVQLRPPSGLFESKLEDEFRVMRQARKASDEPEVLRREGQFRAQAMRIATVQDVHANDLLSWVRTLSEDSYDELEAALERNEWGVELSFAARCRAGHFVQGELPFVSILVGRSQPQLQRLQEGRRAAAMAARAAQQTRTSPRESSG